jgi:CheY-specific phosphatase CheX
MTEDTVRDRLVESAQTVLETMFFATPDTVSMDPQRPAGELIAVSLTFQGSPSGRFQLIVSDLAARTLAANFIGCDDAMSLLPGQVTGVMGELANMMCGAVVSEAESDVSFDLDAPEAIHVGADEPAPDFGAGSPCICRFEFPEGALVSCLTFKEPS